MSGEPAGEGCVSSHLRGSRSIAHRRV